MKRIFVIILHFPGAFFCTLIFAILLFSGFIYNQQRKAQIQASLMVWVFPVSFIVWLFAGIGIIYFLKSKF